MSLGTGLPVGPGGCPLNSGTVGVCSETHGNFSPPHFSGIDSFVYSQYFLMQLAMFRN